jgi:hypothetical protein
MRCLNVNNIQIKAWDSSEGALLKAYLVDNRMNGMWMELDCNICFMNCLQMKSKSIECGSCALVTRISCTFQLLNMVDKSDCSDNQTAWFTWANSLFAMPAWATLIYIWISTATTNAASYKCTEDDNLQYCPTNSSRSVAVCSKKWGCENQSSVDCSVSIKVKKIFCPLKFWDWLWRQPSLLYSLGTGGSFPWHKPTGSGSWLIMSIWSCNLE